MSQKIDIDNLIKSTLKDEGLQEPGIDFSGKVMHSINVSNQKAKVFEPLIPGSILKVVFLVTACIIGYNIFRIHPENATSASYLDNFFNEFKGFHFELQIPANLLYMIAGILILLMIQTIIISRLYNKMQK